MRYHSLVLFLPVALAFDFQFPFNVPFLTKRVPINEITNVPFISKTPRIAIIGAGAGGSSAAFWIHKARERFGLSVDVDVYEKESYIGGRSTVVYPYSNKSLPPLELGASIFVKVNKNLWRASDEFNLTRQAFADGGETGIWDGEELLVSFRDGWWDTVKMILRYGMLSPKRTDQIVQEAVKQFLTLYTEDTPKWDNLSNLAATLGFTGLLQNTTADYYTRSGVSKRFLFEMIEAASRVNYGQNADDIHGLGGTCSMATSGATGIQGGNYQILEQFLGRAGARVHLGTKVTRISEAVTPSSQWAVKTESGTKNYKAVILASPFHLSEIELPPSISASIPKQPYVRLHVTLLTTTSRYPNSTYFGFKENSTLPSMILTTYEGVRNGKKEPEFNSLSYHGLIREGEWAVKIFSKERLSDDWLNNVFSNKIGWIYRKEWDAYPKLTPTTTFPPVRLDQGLYYINAFEPFISTMETETVASRNVVDLMLNDQFGSGICGRRLVATDPPNVTPAPINEEAFVIGWDC